LPEFTEAHYNLANLLSSLGRPAEAVPHYREALRQRPDFAECHNNLGSTLLTLGDADAAVGHLEQAVRLRPDFALAHYNLGNALRERNQVAEGVASYRRALRLKPDLALAHAALGEASLEQGDRQSAESHFRGALRLDPLSPHVLLNLAEHNLYTAADPGIDQLRSWLADPRLSPDFASQLHFTLGHLLDRAGATDEAFDHFRRGNALRRSLFQQSGTAFDPAEHTRHIDRLTAAYSSEYFRRVQGFGLDSELPVFIVGMPRSGTTLVEQILAQHPEVYGAGELKDVGRIASRLPEILDAATTRDLAAAHLRRLTQLGGPAARVTDKMPENFLHLGLIATLFPKACVLHCRRDPRDVCVSCFLQFFKGLNYTWDLDDLGRYYRDYERLMAHWAAVLPLPTLEVAYEDLVANQEAMSRRLVDFCGLAWDERCLKFYENRRPVQSMSKGQVRQPMYRSSVGRWRRYEAHLGPLLSALG
jgi:tetratricopeptide (TPR) repeat protein